MIYSCWGKPYSCYHYDKYKLMQVHFLALENQSLNFTVVGAAAGAGALIAMTIIVVLIIICIVIVQTRKKRKIVIAAE